MLYFANKIATENTMKTVKNYVNDETIRGIKICTKKLLELNQSKNNLVLLIASDVQPADLVSHFVELSTEKNVELLFFKSMYDFDENKAVTCVLLDLNDADYKLVVANK